MVIRLAVSLVLRLSRVKQEISCDQLIGHTRKRPQISGNIIIDPEHDLGSTILPRLDLMREVVVGPAAIAQVTNFELNLFSS